MFNRCQFYVYRLFSVFLAVVFLVPSANFHYSKLNQSNSECGTWKVEISGKEKDARIQTNVITQVSGSDCRGAIRLSNETDVLGFGGYTLELSPSLDKAKAYWVPAGDLDGKTYLLPLIDIEIHATPIDIPSEATIDIEGDMTLGSFTIDLSLFLLRTGFALIPGTGCLISKEQLMFAAFRTSDILRTTARLSLMGDFLGARDELAQVLDEFYQRTGDALEDIGVECAVDLVQSIIKKPLAIVKIGIAYLTWVPVVIIEYYKYGGQPANVLLVYVPKATALPPLNRREISSVLEWIQYALKENDINVFDQLALEEMGYVNNIEGVQPITKQEFLYALSERLPSSPRCDTYAFFNDSGELQIWTSGWSPAWEMNELCYFDCQQLNPPWTSNIAAFLLRETENGWSIYRVWLNDSSIYQDLYNLQMISCD